MLRRFRALGMNPATYWVVALSAIAVWSFIPSYRIGWDFANFRSAIVSLRAAHDPYSDALAVQTAYHEHVMVNPEAAAPLSYVYSPATLPLMRLVGRVPFALSGTLYWLIYALAFPLIIWVGLQWADEDERKIFVYLAPFAVFFPGLLQSDVLFSGNVALILYGCVLGAAVIGWRKDNWWLFYAATLLASTFKAPMLSLVAIPILSSRRQWLPSFMTAAAGIAMFCLQPLLWPGLFGNYMKILDCMFRMERDFSSSPTGVLTEQLSGTMAYKGMLTGLYLVYAIPIFLVLLYLARRYFAGRLTLKEWAPVMLIGVILLNPRIIEYDVAAITLPMALIVWRGLGKNSTVQATIVKMGVLLVFANLLTIIDLPIVHLAWRWTECAMLLGLFTAGASSLYLRSREHVSVVLSYRDEAVMDEVLAEEMAL